MAVVQAPIILNPPVIQNRSEKGKKCPQNSFKKP